MRARSESTGAVVAAVLAAASGSAMGQLDAGDIGLTVEGGRIVTNLIAETGGLSPQRVFLAELGVVEFEDAEPGDPTSGGSAVFQDVVPAARGFSTNTPGFDSDPGTFTAGQSVGFTAINGLRLYVPEQDALVSARNAGAGIGGSVAESLVVEFNTTVFQTDSASGSPFPTSLATPTGGLAVFGNGRFHRHWNFTLFPVDNPFSPNPVSLAEPGVYVLDLVMTATEAGIEDSLPFSILFAYQVDEAGPEVAGAVSLLRRTYDPADVNGDGVRNIFDIFEFFFRFGA